MALKRSPSWENFFDDIITGEKIQEENIPVFRARLYPYSNKTDLGQKFAFSYIKEGDRYKTLLYMDEKHRDLPTIIDTASKIEHVWNKICEQFKNVDNSYSIPCCRDEQCYFKREDDAVNHIKKRYKELKNGLKKEKIRTRERVIPENVNTLEVLQPGDYIRTSLGLGGFVNHDGIYVGRNKVIHVSNHSSSSSNAYQEKKLSCARLGYLVPNFIDKEGTKITILVYPIEFHTSKTIVLNAIDYATVKFREGEYHLKKKNCQHFGALCCTGAERIEDKVAIRKLLSMEEHLIKNLGAMVRLHLSRRLGNNLESTVSLLSEKIKKMLETGEKNTSPVINASWEEIYELIDLLEAAQVGHKTEGGCEIEQEELMVTNERSEALAEAIRKVKEIRDRSSWIPLNNGIAIQNGKSVNLVGGLCLRTIV